MNDKQQSNIMTQDASIPLISGIGARLKAAREALNLSIKEAAGRLHLSIKYIEIIENEDFSQGPPITFIKGYFRSYARLLNFSENEIDQFINQLGMHAPENTVLTTPLWHTASIKYKKKYSMRWMTYIIILVLGLLAFIRWSSHSSDTDTLTNTSDNNFNSIQTPAATPSPPSTTSVEKLPAAQLEDTTPPTVAPDDQELIQPAEAQILQQSDETTEKMQPSGKEMNSISSQPPTEETPSTSEQLKSQDNLLPMKMAIPEPGLDVSDSDDNNN